MKGKKILLGITASIAAYKTISLVRMLIKAGAEVKVVMTPAAAAFVSPLVLETLSRNPVSYDLSKAATWANHVMLGRWADYMLIAPASCNTLAKMASGICDNLLLAVYLSAACPVAVSPAMDEDMWKHPSTHENLNRLRSHGVNVLSVGSGELASGLFGEGRMKEPEELYEFLNTKLISKVSGTLSGKKAIVTAGPTYEAIDPVRFIGNHSSGKMGIALATGLMQAGAETLLILGPGTAAVPDGMAVIRVTSAREMFEAVKENHGEANVLIMAAAVADYRPETPSTQKIKKGDLALSINLVKNPDILSWCGENKKSGQFLVGFALETENGRQNAQEKMKRKKADMIILNSLEDKGAGFGTDTNKVVIFEASGDSTELPLQSKSDIAKRIVERIYQKLNE